jgi:hypothetical protein
MATFANPFAPAAYNGVVQRQEEPYLDVDFTYVYDVVLALNQLLVDQVVPIMNDSDFVWRALILSASTGAFRIRFSDAQGYYFSNGYLLSGNFLVGLIPVPWVINPEAQFPAGGRIGVDIQDLTGAQNTIQLLFRGVKRYRLPA